MDMFPTTLAAMGCTIDGNRLGMGVNLFSGEMTLTEKYGHERLRIELGNHSAYYLEKLMMLDQTSILRGNNFIGYALTSENGTHLLPLRKITEEYNGTVNWTNAKTVVKYKGKKIEFDNTEEKSVVVTWKDRSEKTHSKSYICTTALNVMHIEESFFSDALGLKFKFNKKENTITFE